MKLKIGMYKKIIFIFMLFSTFNLITSAEWTELKHLRKLDHFVSFYATSPDTVIALNCNNKVLRTSDGGFSWDTISIPRFPQDISNTPKHFIFTDKKHGFIQGYNDSILKTIDGGITWQSISTDIEIAKLWFIDSLNGWILNKNNEIFKTKDCGKVWTPVTFDSIYNFSLIQIIDKSTAWNRIYKNDTSWVLNTTDFYNWRVVHYYHYSYEEHMEGWDAHGFAGFSAIDKNTIVLKTYHMYGRINDPRTFTDYFWHKSIDNATSWPLIGYFKVVWEDIKFINNDTGWHINERYDEYGNIEPNAIFKTINNGKNWLAEYRLSDNVQLLPDQCATLTNIQMLNNDNGWAIGFFSTNSNPDSALVLKYSNTSNIFYNNKKLNSMNDNFIIHKNRLILKNIKIEMYEVFNVSGQRLRYIHFNNKQYPLKIIDFNTLPNGFYFVRLHCNSKKEVIKINKFQ